MGKKNKFKIIMKIGNLYFLFIINNLNYEKL